MEKKIISTLVILSQMNGVRMIKVVRAMLGAGMAPHEIEEVLEAMRVHTGGQPANVAFLIKRAIEESNEESAAEIAAIREERVAQGLPYYEDEDPSYHGYGII